MHRFATPRGEILINLDHVQLVTIGESQTFLREDGFEYTGPSVNLWFNRDEFFIVNATLSQIEALTQ